MEYKAKSIQDITDGTSNTFLLGERDTQICHSGTWVGVRNPNGLAAQGLYSVTANVYVKLNSPDPPIVYTDAEKGCLQGFSSLHPGGANFALADGSVRFVSNNIEFKSPTGTGADGTSRNIFTVHNPRATAFAPVYSVYTRLGRRNDGYPVGDY